MKLKTSRQSIVITLISLVLAACSGGGGDGVNQDLNDSSYDQYTGIATPANLRADILGAFASIVLSDTFELIGEDSASSGNANLQTRAALNVRTMSQQGARNVAVNDSFLCAVSGTTTIRGTVNDGGMGTLTLHYDHCDDGGNIIDGDITANIVDSSLRSFETVFFVQKLSIVEDGHRYSLSGRVRDIENNYENITESTADLVLIDLDSLTQVKLENYITKGCPSGCGEEYEEFVGGRIYHSDYGYVDVLTTVPLKRELYGYTQARRLTAGQLKFDGATNSSFMLGIEYIEVVSSGSINKKIYLLHIELDGNGDSVFETEAVFSAPLHNQYVIYDIADDDSDGMPNGWEKFYGFNPNIPNDENLDSDNDGYTDQHEYLRYGNPHDETVVPVVTDLFAGISARRGDVRAGQVHYLSVSATNPNVEYGATDITITLTKSPDLEWETPTTSDDPNQKTWHVDYVHEHGGRAFSVGVLGEPGEFTVSVTVTSATFDSDLTNNTALLTASFSQRVSDLSLSLKRLSARNGHSDVAVVDYPHVFDIDIGQYGLDDAHNTIVRMSLPDLVRVISADYYLNGTFVKTCIVGADVFCDMDTMRGIGLIRVNVVGETEGYSEFTVSIQSDAIDNNLLNNSLTQEMFVGKSLQPIQDQIDDATDSLTINLDAGMYVGGLDFSGKSIILSGDPVRGLTIIRATSPIVGLPQHFHLSSNSTIKNIYFKGERDDISVSSAFPNLMNFFGAENLLIENNIFEEHGDNGIGIYGSGGKNITIRNNIFRHSRSRYACTLITLNGNGSYLIENNLMHDNDCIAIDISREYFSPATYDYTYGIINNTFVNNRKALAVSIATNGVMPKIENNIFSHHLVGISVDVPFNFDINTQSYILPSIAHNLFSDNVADIELDPEIDPARFDNTTNLYQFPLFEDPDNFDYRLKIGSPAIDVASDLNAPKNDLNNAIRPVDGNLDLLSETDIGAFEYQP